MSDNGEPVSWSSDEESLQSPDGGKRKRSRDAPPKEQPGKRKFLPQHTARQCVSKLDGVTVVHNAGGVQGLHLALNVITPALEEKLWGIYDTPHQHKDYSPQKHHPAGGFGSINTEPGFHEVSVQ